MSTLLHGEAKRRNTIKEASSWEVPYWFFEVPVFMGATLATTHTVEIGFGGTEG